MTPRQVPGIAEAMGQHLDLLGVVTSGLLSALKFDGFIIPITRP